MVSLLQQAGFVIAAPRQNFRQLMPFQGFNKAALMLFSQASQLPYLTSRLSFFGKYTPPKSTHNNNNLQKYNLLGRTLAKLKSSRRYLCTANLF